MTLQPLTSITSSSSASSSTTSSSKNPRPPTTRPASASYPSQGIRIQRSPSVAGPPSRSAQTPSSPARSSLPGPQSHLTPPTRPMHRNKAPSISSLPLSMTSMNHESSIPNSNSKSMSSSPIYGPDSKATGNAASPRKARFSLVAPMPPPRSISTVPASPPALTHRPFSEADLGESVPPQSPGRLPRSYSMGTRTPMELADPKTLTFFPPFESWSSDDGDNSSGDEDDRTGANTKQSRITSLLSFLDPTSTGNRTSPAKKRPSLLDRKTDSVAVETLAKRVRQNDKLVLASIHIDHVFGEEHQVTKRRLSSAPTAPQVDKIECAAVDRPEIRAAEMSPTESSSSFSSRDSSQLSTPQKETVGDSYFPYQSPARSTETTSPPSAGRSWRAGSVTGGRMAVGRNDSHWSLDSERTIKPRQGSQASKDEEYRRRMSIPEDWMERGQAVEE